ncbi:hypothetical protein NA57DRAFT_75813 [Rhizodiscina lignyota]|uniref:Zn(2)-C6 fungal-type domain-containing protein n=1 Tax=Rhizodiscina lignyota TaxID=1504668 RepID=A0A9P4MAA5_9PEZI|nr:hypothetical protein NA57DRAFT_75813 [Rhizodiscina lignyota]
MVRREQEVRVREAKGARRKAGCIACRSRHVRCDEEKPICRECRRRNLDCNYPDFIVASQWCPPAATQEAESTPIATTGAIDNNPQSTWDIFNLSRNELATISPLDSPAVQLRGPQAQNIDRETAELLRVYQTGIATWMDIFDHRLCYQRDVPRRAIFSLLIRQSICALSAKQISLLKGGSVHGSVAAARYGDSLRLLLAAFAEPQSNQEDILTATILLSSYELLAAPGLDHRKHIHGATTLIKSQKIDSQCQGINKATFQIYVRQDIAVALMNECPTNLSPQEWNVTWPSGEVEDEARGNHILWLCSRAINLIYTADISTRTSLTYFSNVAEVSREVEEWFNQLPSESKGLTCGQASWEGFVDIWFPVSAAAAAMATYHEIKLLLLAEQKRRPLPEDENYDEIQYHANQIGSIALSQISDGALVQIVQPLYYAAKYIDGRAKKARIWMVLNDIESRLGFHTRTRIEQLQRLDT